MRNLDVDTDYNISFQSDAKPNHRSKKVTRKEISTENKL